MRGKLFTTCGIAVVLAGATLGLEADAHACGGCFVPTEIPTVVTDHRMILTVSQDQTTLYDQIKYSGSPASFAWVLPISGTVTVGLSADIVFQSLDVQTQTRIVSPPLNCPAPPDTCATRNAGTAVPGAASDTGGGGVTVISQQVVGPYQTVQLAATDPAALETWLAQNNFVIPADVKPVVDQYVTEKFNFLALKLIPGAGIQDMRPVRVTTTGASAVLPLRMVAAGTGPTVGITLWVLSEGRYESQNFPSFHIDDTELVWDWTQNKSNYIDLRAQKTAAANGRVWELESSISMEQTTLLSQVTHGYGGSVGLPASQAEQIAQQDYLPITDGTGTVTQTAVQVRDADFAALFHGIPAGVARVTRVRADLAHAALDQDLVMTAAQDQSLLSNVRQVTHELNEPLCPVYNGCSQTGQQLPRSQAASQTATNNNGTETFGCTTASRTRSTGLGLGAAAGLLALTIGSAVRRRRARDTKKEG